MFLLIVVFSFNIVVLVLFLFLILVFTSLFYYIHCCTSLYCYFHALLLSTFVPCCSHTLLHFDVARNFHALLHLVVKRYCTSLLHLATPHKPCCSSLSRLATLHCHSLILLLSHLAACALLPCHRASLHYIVPYYYTLLVVAPCCLAITACYLPFPGTSWPPPPPPLLFCCLVACCLALLICLVSWYSLLTFLCKWRSLEQHQQVSSNNKGFFFSIFLEFFFPLWYFICLFCFCFSFFFGVE